MIEEWRQIECAYGPFTRYEVSNLGNIRAIRVNKQGQDVSWHIKQKYKKFKAGNIIYWAIGLQDPKKKHHHTREFLVHRLIADAFIPNPQNYQYVEHIDKNTLNNELTNLRWRETKVDLEVINKNLLLGAKALKKTRETLSRLEQLRCDWIEGKRSAEEICKLLFEEEKL